MQDSPGKFPAYRYALQHTYMFHIVCIGKSRKREDYLNFCSYLEQSLKNKVDNKSLGVFNIK